MDAEKKDVPPVALPQEQMEQLAILQVKNQMQLQIHGLYQAFSDAIKNLPINPAMKQYSLFNVDQGLLWVQDAIRSAEIKIQAVAQPGEKSAEPVEKPAEAPVNPE